MWNLKDNIFRYFGRYEKEIDPNKDIEYKGTLERFNETVACEFDLIYYPLIVNLFDNVLNPCTNFEQYLEYLIEGVGAEELVITTFLSIQRNLMKFIHEYYKIKGTIRGYELLLNLIGLTGTVTEFDNDYTLDSPYTFDDDVRVFDAGGCNDCFDYQLSVGRLIGTSALTDFEILAIQNIITFNEPINARLRTLIDENNNNPIVLGDYSPLDFNIDYFTQL